MEMIQKMVLVMVVVLIRRKENDAVLMYPNTVGLMAPGTIIVRTVRIKLMGIKMRRLLKIEWMVVKLFVKFVMNDGVERKILLIL